MQHENNKILYGNSQKDIVISNVIRLAEYWGWENISYGLRYHWDFFQSPLKGTNLQVCIHSWGTLNFKTFIKNN